MRRTDVLKQPLGRFVHSAVKTIKECEHFKHGGYLRTKLPQRCMFTSSRKLYPDSGKQQDLKRFLEEVSCVYNSQLSIVHFWSSKSFKLMFVFLANVCMNIISQDHVKVREWKVIEIVKYWSSGISKVILSCNKIHVSLIKYQVLWF